MGSLGEYYGPRTASSVFLINLYNTAGLKSERIIMTQGLKCDLDCMSRLTSGFDPLTLRIGKRENGYEHEMKERLILRPMNALAV